MNGFKIENLKLFKRKSTRVLIILYAIVIFFVSAVYFLGEKNIGLSIFNEGQFITASLGITMSMILPFIALYITSTSFALDFSNGSIKNMFLLPIEKGQIFINKIISVQSLLLILLTIQFIFTLVFSFLLDGGFSLNVLANSVLEYLGAFLILGLVSLASAAISLLVSSTGLTILISYLVYTGIGIGNMYFPRLATVSFTRIVNSYNALLTNFDFSLLLSIAGYYILLYIAGTLLFDKKEESVCQYE